MREFADVEMPTVGRPRIREYGPQIQRLDVIANRLAELIAATRYSATGKWETPPVMPTPETARDRLEREQFDEQFDSLMADIEAAQRRSAE